MSVPRSILKLQAAIQNCPGLCLQQLLAGGVRSRLWQTQRWEADRLGTSPGAALAATEAHGGATARQPHRKPDPASHLVFKIK